MLRTAGFYTAAFTLLLAAILIWLGVSFNHGLFFYPVDDAYIHLALAENLPWHYGLQSTTPAAASSSLLYPWLLLIGKPVGLLEYMPLFYGLLGLAGISFAFAGLSAHLPLIPQFVKSPWLKGLVLALLILALNLVAVSLLGLEHALHIAVVLFILLGLLQRAHGLSAGPLFTIALMLNPLLRYEGFALTFLVGGLLFYQHERGRAWLVVLVPAGLALAQGLWWHSVGLPWLPSSVLAKATHLEATSGWSGILLHILSNPVQSLRETGTAKVFLVLLVLLLALLPAMYRRRPQSVPFLVVVAGAMGAHLVFGKFDPSARYHIYALLLGLGALVHVMANLRLFGSFESTVLVLILISPLLPHNYIMTLSTPLSMNDVYLQQYQMHRLLTAYIKAPVAVNDLGWVSYKADYPILDVCGLGSDQVRRQRATNWTPATANQLVQDAGAHLAMIYPDYCMPGPPADWQLVAKFLRLEKRNFGIYPLVYFYQTNSGDTTVLRQQLKDFAATLPPETELILQ